MNEVQMMQATIVNSELTKQGKKAPTTFSRTNPFQAKVLKNIDLNLYQTPKAERYTAVAAASILARAKVVDWFNIRSREVGFQIPKGGGASVNTSAKRVLHQFDDNYLMKMIKFHFKNSQSIFKK